MTDCIAVPIGEAVGQSIQYDPQQDFGIFRVGDPTRGGVQNLKEKMNLADAD